MTLKEFKGTCYHTRTRVVIPALKTYLSKINFMTRAKFDPKKLDKKLDEIYEQHKTRLEAI